MRNESRYRMVEQAQPARFKMLVEAAKADIRDRYALYAELAGHKAGK